jgi:phage tail sheath protein FI
MPEYLAPGVYVEEVSFRSKSIEGVSTTTTAFVGSTRYGPVLLTPDVLTSVVEFERTYGDRQQIGFDDGDDLRHNYMWHAARAFFENGGKRLYVSRVYRPKDGNVSDLDEIDDLESNTNAAAGGFGHWSGGALRVFARFPGAAGNMQVRITLNAGPNILATDKGQPVVRGLQENDVVLFLDGDQSPPSSPLESPLGSSPPTDPFAIAVPYIEAGHRTWRFRRTGDAADGGIELSSMTSTGASIRVVTATVTIFPTDPTLPSWVYPDLALDPEHKRSGAPDSLRSTFALEQPSLGLARSVPIVMLFGDDVEDGIDVVKEILERKPIPANDNSFLEDLIDSKSTDAERSYGFGLEGGDDGLVPQVGEYEGVGGDPTSKHKSGLTSLEDIDEVSIVAAPGSSFNYATDSDNVLAIVGAVISHATRMRYRIAVLDSGDKQSIADVRDMRGKVDSTYAALYYPWYTIVDPVTRQEINVPPSGAVAGIYARNDINRGVYKAPANEVVETAIGLEKILNKSQQDVLNPLGVNCFRFFEGRGFRLWGARTISSDPEWKYVNLRRYFAYLEHSIDKGTQWAVFEPNGELLWRNVRSTISDFLLNEWQNGALLGDKAESAYFVKCDRSTMTQNDLDNGRLVCLVGVAALRPAEYVIIRIGQWTADRKV